MKCPKCDGTGAVADAPTLPGLAPDAWPADLAWVPPVVNRVFDRFPEPFGTRADFLRPDAWRKLAAEVDSWGRGLGQRFADELEVTLAEFEGYWTSRKIRRKDAWRCFVYSARRWHDRQLGQTMRAEQMAQTRGARRQ